MPPYAVAGLTNLCTAKIKTMLDSIACRKVKDHTYFVNCKDVCTIFEISLFSK